jgi:catechol 1,2-dioxygenase
LASEAGDTATASAILGPFFRHDAPLLDNESTIVHGVEDGKITYMHGLVIDHQTKQPVPNAVIDVWQASTNGLYEQQDEDQIDCNLRGKFKTDSNGRYAFYCLKPTPYPVPFDGMMMPGSLSCISAHLPKSGPAGQILKMLDRHPFRPAHIHLIVSLKMFHPTVILPLAKSSFDRWSGKAISQLLRKYSTKRVHT